MNVRVWMVAGALALTSLPITAQQASLDEPIRTGLHIDRRAPSERSLAERIANLDAALVVRIVGERQGIAVGVPHELFGPLVNAPSFDPPPFIHSEYVVEVVEVLKVDAETPRPGARLSIAVSGGEARWKGRRMIAPNSSPTLSTGDIYVMLLSRSLPGDVPFAYDDDIFHVSDGRVIAHGTPHPWPYTQSVRNQPLTRAMAAFRAAARAAR